MHIVRITQAPGHFKPAIRLDADIPQVPVILVPVLIFIIIPLRLSGVTIVRRVVPVITPLVLEVVREVKDIISIITQPEFFILLCHLHSPHVLLQASTPMQ